MKMNNSLDLFDQFVKKKSKSNFSSSHRNAVIYTRVSTKEQADNNQSLETQKKACEVYAQKHGFSVISYFGGTYESAKTDERNEFKRMLTYVKRSKEKIGYIIVYSVDRFSRSGANAIYIASELKKEGISVIAVTQPTDTNTPSGSLQQNIQFIFSQYDNDLRREKCMAGVKEKLLKGYWPHKAPIGYDQVTKSKEQQITVNAKGKLIRKAFLWKAEEGLSSQEILSRLKAQGLYLAPQSLSDLFRNPFYCGLITHNMLDGQVIEGKHEKLVSKEVFLKANGVLAKNAQHYKHQAGNANIPLKHFIKCADCGTPFVGYIVKAKDIYYYKCNKAGCKCNRNAKKMNDQFRELLKAYTIDSRFIEPLKYQLEVTFHKMNEANIENRQVLLKTLKEIEGKIELVDERYVLNEISKELYDKFTAKYREEKRNIQAQLEKVDFQLSNLSEYITKSLEIAANIDKLWDSASFSDKEKVQYMLFPEGIYYERKNSAYRTDRVNTVFTLIASLTSQLENKKTGQSGNESDLSGLVENIGVEPMTSSMPWKRSSQLS